MMTSTMLYKVAQLASFNISNKDAKDSRSIELAVEIIETWFSSTNLRLSSCTYKYTSKPQ